MAEIQRVSVTETHDLSPSRAGDAAVITAPAKRMPVPSNQEMQSLLQSHLIQAKLNVSSPDDVYEKEADRTADTIMRAAVLDEKKKVEPQKTPAKKKEETVKRAIDTEQSKKEEEREWEELKKPDEDVYLKAEDEKKEPEKEPSEKKKEENEVQRSPAIARKGEGRVSLSAGSTASQRPQVPYELEAGLVGKKGGGAQLPQMSRTFFEERLGRDLGEVRIHSDPWAANAASLLNAQAFTRGEDIYFGASRYQPDSEDGRRLIAHELVHTMQQDSGQLQGLTRPARPRPTGGNTLFRQPKNVGEATPLTTPAPAGPGAEGSTVAEIDPSTLPLSTGRPDPKAKTITFDNIDVPAFKLTAHRGQLYAKTALRQKKHYQRGNTDQRSVWKQIVGEKTTAVADKLEKDVNKALGGAAVDRTQTHVFTTPTRYGRRPPRYFVGDLPTVAREMVLPTWDSQGRAKSYDVDHIVELQLSNWDTDRWANTIENMELLDSGINRQSGSLIKGSIDRRVQKFVNDTQGRFGANIGQVKTDYDLIFEKVIPSKAGPQTIPETEFWTAEQIQRGDQVNSAVRVSDMSALGGQGSVVVFPDVTGGTPRKFRWPGKVLASERSWLEPYRIMSKSFTTDEDLANSEKFGELTFNIPASDNKWMPFENGDQSVPIHRIRGARYAGYVDKRRVLDTLRRLRSKKFSPIEVTSFDIPPEGGLMVSGQIRPELPLLGGTTIDFEMANGNLQLYKEFITGDFAVPPPFRVTNSTLVVFAGTKDIGVKGNVEFGISRVGQGFFKASSGISGGLDMEGHFSFDTSLFKPAEITLRYQENKLSGKGKLGIPPNRVRGIRSASIDVSYENERLDATGTAVFTVPGVQSGTLTVSFSEAEGMMLGGKLLLADNIPGIRSGSIDSLVRARPGVAGYDVTARGTAVPAIPGVNATLNVAYENGFLTIDGSATYSRGLLNGSLQIGVTNRPLDVKGVPVTGGESKGELRAYGGGTVTIRITPWLQGTIGVRLLPNGEVEVVGDVSLPSSQKIFDEKVLDKNIFNIGIDIPIVGVAILGQRIGIFATIRGGLDAKAAIGPGQLRELGLSVTYNPSHEDQTRVGGRAQLYVPAHAGLRLFVRGGLGVGIPIVSASANLEVSGSLGLEGAATAWVEVDWMPSRSLRLDAAAELFVQPRFVFDVTGMVLVEADLLLKTVELYSKKWDLASFEYGSNLRFGIRFPVHYQEGKPFSISLSDVQFDVPRVDPGDILKGLVKSIV